MIDITRRFEISDAVEHLLQWGYSNQISSIDLSNITGISLPVVFSSILTGSNDLQEDIPSLQDVPVSAAATYDLIQLIAKVCYSNPPP